jgi:predicted ArsR family transcriptional regulator
MSDSVVTPGLEQLKALTHPVRVRMLGLLRLEGPATATTLATRLGLNTGATSYHLRQLAQHGFIVEDESRGTGRERWWRAAHTATHTAPEELPEGSGEVLDAYVQSVVTTYIGWIQQAMEERPLLPEEWRRASTFSDRVQRLTAAQAKALVDRIDEVVRDAEGDPDGESFVVQVNAFPFPGRLGGSPS